MAFPGRAQGREREVKQSLQGQLLKAFAGSLGCPCVARGNREPLRLESGGGTASKGCFRKVQCGGRGQPARVEGNF